MPVLKATLRSFSVLWRKQTGGGRSGLSYVRFTVNSQKNVHNNQEHKSLSCFKKRTSCVILWGPTTTTWYVHHFLVLLCLSFLYEPWLKVFWEKFDRIWRKLFCFGRRISIWDADPRQPLSSLQKKKKMFCSEVREGSHCYALTIAPPRPSQWEGNQVLGLLLDFLGGGNLGLFRCVW